ncbi:MAG: TIR domain-containing protein [bacterium]|nr:TIR domain-containing protein [bacterium]
MDPARPSFKIFLSYRRGDTAGWVENLHGVLAERYGEAAVFFDREEIEPGAPFPYEIESAVTGAAIVLVVVGERWLTIEDDDGNRRLDDSEDWVAAEVELALKGAGDVVPVLVGGAAMPEAAELPAKVQGLAARQAAELSPSRWDEDVRRLQAAIDRLLKGKRRQPPWRWALAAALGATVLAAFSWLLDLAAVPGLGWSQRWLENALARQVPATFDAERLALVEIEESDEEPTDQRRQTYAGLFATLAGAGAEVVALDAYFDWDKTPEPGDAGRALATSIAAAASDGTRVVVGSKGLPTGGAESPLPAWMNEAIGDRWGHVSPGVTPSAGGPFPKVEIARLKHDPALLRSSELSPTLALRAVMELLGAPLARYDWRSGEIHLCGEHGERSSDSSEACGPDRRVLRASPVVMEDVPLKDLGETSRAGDAHLLLVPVQLMPEPRYRERTVAATATDRIERARTPFVILGSTRDKRQDVFGGLVGYQVHAQVASDVLLERSIRPADAGLVIPGIAVAALVGALWRRRRRRPLEISDPSSPTKHWALSGIDMAVVGVAVAVVSYLAALTAFKSGLVILTISYFVFATAAAYLMLALIERRKAL